MDPSEGMMQKLETRGLYTNKYVEFVGMGQSTVPKGGSIRLCLAVIVSRDVLLLCLHILV